MVAPTGVNEGLPGEPAKAGRGGAELAKPQAAEAETSETETSDTRTAEAETADGGTAQVGPVQAAEGKAAPAGVIPAEVVPLQAGPAEEERVPAGPTDATSAGAGKAGKADTAVKAQTAEAAGTEPAEETGDWDAEEVRRDIRPLAVVGIILGIIALVGVAAGVLVVVTHGFRHKTVVTVTYRPPAVFGLRPGQCVNTGSDALKPTVVSCARPHDAEVFAVFTLPAAPWPGTSAVRMDADNGCASRFGSYVDPQLATAGLAQEFVYPNRDAWQADQRTVVCEVSAGGGRLTGSVRATG